MRPGTAALKISGAAPVPVLYRIVHTNPPTLDDFRPNLSKCLPPRGPELGDLTLWAGLSTYATLHQAERAALRYPRLGAYVGRLEIPDELANLVVRQTLGPGHHTLMGCGETCLRLVADVIPIAGLTTGLES
jgi:hypothetical protein